MEYIYILTYIYTSTDGAEERGQCEVKARSMFNAVYQFYQAHGFKYEVIGYTVK